MRELTFIMVLGKRVLFIWLVFHDGNHFQVIEVKIRLVKTDGDIHKVKWWIVWLLKRDHPGPIDKLIGVYAYWLLFLFYTIRMFFSFIHGLFRLGGLVITRPGFFEVGRITRPCLYHENNLGWRVIFPPFIGPRCPPFLYPLLGHALPQYHQTSPLSRKPFR